MKTTLARKVDAAFDWLDELGNESQIRRARSLLKNASSPDELLGVVELAASAKRKLSSRDAAIQKDKLAHARLIARSLELKKELSQTTDLHTRAILLRERSELARQQTLLVKALLNRIQTSFATRSRCFKHFRGLQAEFQKASTPARRDQILSKMRATLDDMQRARRQTATSFSSMENGDTFGQNLI